MTNPSAVAAALASLLLAGAAQAVTITDGPERVGTPIELDPTDFVGSGPCGSGGSVVEDGCSVVLKNDPAAPDAYGRFDPWGNNWIDSQDLSEVVWTLSPGIAFRSLTFALTDAYDQPFSDEFGAGYFSLSVDEAEWAIDEQEANGTLHWLTVSFDEFVTTATVSFFTRQNDGWGIKAALVSPDPMPSPVPLPAAGWLMLAALGGLVALHRRRTAA
jgi:hypothetical protein